MCSICIYPDKQSCSCLADELVDVNASNTLDKTNTFICTTEALPLLLLMLMQSVSLAWNCWEWWRIPWCQSKRYCYQIPLDKEHNTFCLAETMQQCASTFQYGWLNLNSQWVSSKFFASTCIYMPVCIPVRPEHICYVELHRMLICMLWALNILQRGACQPSVDDKTPHCLVLPQVPTHYLQVQVDEFRLKGSSPIACWRQILNGFG